MRGIFFIVGTGRCGTNLCQQMLNLHPEITAVTETHFISTLVALFGKRQVAFADFFSVMDEHYTSDGSRKWSRLHAEAGGHDPKTFRSDLEAFCARMNPGTVKEYVEAFFGFCYGEGSHLLGDKTPTYGRHMSAFLELWPDAKFIHLIRDGRYAATSMQKHLGFVRVINAGLPDEVEYGYRGAQRSHSTEPVSLRQCILYWARIATAIRRQSLRVPQDAYLEVHYEDLVAHPARELVRIAKFLKVPLSLDWLAKACVIPRPLSLWRERRRIRPLECSALTRDVSHTLKAFGYPTRSYRFAQLIETARVVHAVTSSRLWRLVSAGLTTLGFWGPRIDA